jgi:hypothetical protein
VKLTLDKAMATGEQTTRLTAANATEHVAFQRTLDDPEGRLTRLEHRRR